MGLSKWGVDRQREEDRAELLDVLADRRRQETIAVLREEERSMSLVELSHHLMEGVQWPHPNEARNLQLVLYHRHLPKLDDVGLIEFDPDEKTVTPTERALELHW